MHRLSDFDFQLPPELIAQHPAPQRTGSRLLHVKPGQALQDLFFKDLLQLIHPGDVLVFNNSKVIPARLFGTKETGGQVEILIERITGPYQATAMLRVSKKPAPGSMIELRSDQAAKLNQTAAFANNTNNAKNSEAPPSKMIVLEGRDPQHDDRFLLRFQAPILEVLEAYGQIPLPPYIEHTPGSEDAQRYQTVYAQTPGSVAAPTAGLHFDQEFLAALDAKGVKRAALTLHVGTGTFAPVRTEAIDQHRMHSEWCEVPQATADLIAQARREKKRVIAVGTTSLRTLESGALAPSDAQRGCIKAGAWETDIFIRPGYEFKVVDALLTNFHLPKSTLLMLVAAFVGYDTMRAAYAHAVERRYSFFSYGDAMFCEK